MTTDDLCLLDLVEVERRIQSGRLSSVAVTQAVFARIAKLDPHLRSYATLTADLALAQATQADAEIARGNIRGPMHGVPIAVKDLCHTKGIPTSAGMTIHKTFRPDRDATVVTRLRARTVRVHGNHVRWPPTMVHVPEVQAFGGRYFRCRQCYGLVYASTREPPHQRAINWADRLRKRVGGGRGAFDGESFPPKPPRMRWRTYRSLEQQYEELQGRWLVGVTAGTAQLLERLRRGRKRK